MKMKAMLGLTLAGLVGLLALGSAKASYRCSLTGKTVEQCCCVQKEDGLYCPLAERRIEKCCCEKIS